MTHTADHVRRSDAGDGARTRREGHVLVITLDRPHARNAVDRATATAIERAMDVLDSDDDLFAGVITGAGGTFRPGLISRRRRAASGPNPNGAGASACSGDRHASRCSPPWRATQSAVASSCAWRAT